MIYEGHVFYGGRASFPAPHLFEIVIAETPEEALDQLKRSKEHSRLLFREDGFDPVSMVRRGRVYEPHGSQPTECHVQPVGEAELDEARRENSSVVRKMLFCYERYPLCSRVSSRQPFAAIGTASGYTMWRIVSNDRTYFERPCGVESQLFTIQRFEGTNVRGCRRRLGQGGGRSTPCCLSPKQPCHG